MSVLTVGSLYVPNYRGTPWSQPGGIGTTVYPQEQINVPFTNYPVPGQTWFEAGFLWTSGCQHWYNCVEIFKDYDDATSQSAAVIACPLCSFIIRLIEPYSEIYNPLTNPIVIP